MQPYTPVIDSGINRKFILLGHTSFLDNSISQFLFPYSLGFYVYIYVKVSSESWCWHNCPGLGLGSSGEGYPVERFLINVMSLKSSFFHSLLCCIIQIEQ